MDIIIRVIQQTGGNLLSFDWYFYIILFIIVSSLNLYIKYVFMMKDMFEQSDLNLTILRLVRVSLFLVAAYSISQLVMIHNYPGLYVIKNLL